MIVMHRSTCTQCCFQSSWTTDGILCHSRLLNTFLYYVEIKAKLTLILSNKVSVHMQDQAIKLLQQLLHDSQSAAEFSWSILCPAYSSAVRNKLVLCNSKIYLFHSLHLSGCTDTETTQLKPFIAL
jgi:hypothetical protein